ncbi:MAG TPA: tetratricopeptide repeat protein, partial [Kribbella sp.]|uniref:tetratricopeptide repeat protein n=1 Tax=Kribbella sp. TaxID=1871183 RepID=UPI002D777AD7
DHDQAIEQVEAALAIGRRQQDANAIAHQLNNLAIIYLALGRYDEAVVTATEAFEQSHDVPEERVRAYTHDTLAQAVASRGEVDRAAVHFEASVTINLTLGQPAPAARGLIRLGKAYLSAGDQAAARAAWERVLAMVDEYGATRLQDGYSEALELIAELDRSAQ